MCLIFGGYSPRDFVEIMTWNDSELCNLERHLGITIPKIQEGYERSERLLELVAQSLSSLPKEVSFGV